MLKKRKRRRQRKKKEEEEMKMRQKQQNHPLSFGNILLSFEEKKFNCRTIQDNIMCLIRQFKSHLNHIGNGFVVEDKAA